MNLSKPHVKYFSHFCRNLKNLINKKQLTSAAAFMLLAFLLYHCANPVSPTGGPQDVKAPGVVSSSPENYALQFDKSRISITFDEFVKLKNPNQQVLISPPLEENPEYKLRGKTLIIDLQEELMTNTTYTIFFGNAIVDLTEENPLTNYLYAFSTGDYIDTLAIGGEVVNAFNLQPREDLFVMLFPPSVDTVPDDSIPMLTRPLYVAKTDINGQFQLRNLRDLPYQLFALNDVDNNYLFNQPNEEIAFLDSLIRPEIIEKPEPDTLPESDSLFAAADSIPADSAVVQRMYDKYYQLFMFQQVDSTQRLLEEDVFWPPKFRLNYAFPADDPKFTVINQDPGSDWKIEQLNRHRDSLTVWIKDMSLDSLEISVADGDTILDTLMIAFGRLKEQDSRPKGRKDEQTVKRINIRTNASGSKIELGKPFRLIMGNPLQSWDFTTTRFIAGEDTMTGAPFMPYDSIGLIFELDYELEEATNYEFLFPDSSFYSIYDLTNDSLEAAFTTGEIRAYGKLILKLEPGEHPYIIQLLNEKERILQEHYITEAQTLELDFLKPGMYLLKAIQDKWRNRSWDTGIYTEKRQPENVFYFPAEIQVRANWDIEETWALP